jgi:hypothetical protein
MKKILVITVAVLSLVTVAFISIEGIDGNWSGIFTGPDDFKATTNYTLKNVNGTLTGSAQSPNNNEYEISDGKVKGDSLSFSIVVDNGDKIINTGRYYPVGDSISLTVAFMGSTMHGTLKRVTNK